MSRAKSSWPSDSSKRWGYWPRLGEASRRPHLTAPDVTRLDDPPEAHPFDRLADPRARHGGPAMIQAAIRRGWLEGAARNGTGNAESLSQ